jgi:hypothetical protein
MCVVQNGAKLRRVKGELICFFGPVLAVLFKALILISYFPLTVVMPTFAGERIILDPRFDSLKVRNCTDAIHVNLMFKTT